MRLGKGGSIRARTVGEIIQYASGQRFTQILNQMPFQGIFAAGCWSRPLGKDFVLKVRFRLRRMQQSQGSQNKKGGEPCWFTTPLCFRRVLRQEQRLTFQIPDGS